MVEPTLPAYTMSDLGRALRRKAPAASRNVESIGDVLEDWLPARGLVLELASGTGEHALAFARRFPQRTWQPSDPDPLALASIAAWAEEGPENLLPPLAIDAASPHWPVARADCILNINMVHISPWPAALGLLDGAGKRLAAGSRMILYGPWFEHGVSPAPSNVAFDRDLKARDPAWGLRTVEEFAAEADQRGLELVERRHMPANNLMLMFERLSR